MHLLQQNNQTGTFVPVFHGIPSPQVPPPPTDPPTAALSVGPQPGRWMLQRGEPLHRAFSTPLAEVFSSARPHPAPALLHLSLPGSDPLRPVAILGYQWESFSEILGGICTEDGYAAALLLWLGHPGPKNRTQERTPGTAYGVADLGARLSSAWVVVVIAAGSGARRLQRRPKPQGLQKK